MIYVIEEMEGHIPIPEEYAAKVGAEAVFTVGSMAWCGSLAHNNYQNNVARLADNVLRRFLKREGFP